MCFFYHEFHVCYILVKVTLSIICQSKWSQILVSVVSDFPVATLSPALLLKLLLVSGFFQLLMTICLFSLYLKTLFILFDMSQPCESSGWVFGNLTFTWICRVC